MKKIVRQQNYLRELIDTQGNRFLSKQALRCLVRSALEPLLDSPEEGVVLYRIINTEGLQGLLKRLEFSEIESYSYADDSKNLIEKVWANTEFLCVMTHRYVSILMWDYHTGDDKSVRYYALYNTKLQSEPLDIIKRNSKIDIMPYIERFKPDRRDNILLNSSIRRLLDNLDEASSDAVLGYAEKNAATIKPVDYNIKKTRIIAHEIKNQLSICDLYAEIIRKYVSEEKLDSKGITNAANAITKALKMAGNSLIALKSSDTPELKKCNLSEIVENSIELASVYAEGKNIKIEIENIPGIYVLADDEKLSAIIINLIKNAAEAFEIDELSDNVQNDKYIKIMTEKEEDFVNIRISNNAPGIKNPEIIFKEGFTTKESGSGLGLWICKKSIEEQLGELELSRYSEDYTEFTIKLGIVNREE